MNLLQQKHQQELEMKEEQVKNVLKDHQDDYNINVAMLNKTRDENENLKKMFSQKDRLNEEKLKERNEVNKKLLQAATILKKQSLQERDSNKELLQKLNQ